MIHTYNSCRKRKHEKYSEKNHGFVDLELMIRMKARRQSLKIAEKKHKPPMYSNFVLADSSYML